jgi:hypothetical protein
MQLRLDVAAYPSIAEISNPFFDIAQYTKTILLDVPAQTKPSEVMRSNQYVDNAWRYASSERSNYQITFHDT